MSALAASAKAHLCGERTGELTQEPATASPNLLLSLPFGCAQANGVDGHAYVRAAREEMQADGDARGLGWVSSAPMAVKRRRRLPLSVHVLPS